MTEMFEPKFGEPITLRILESIGKVNKFQIAKHKAIEKGRDIRAIDKKLSEAMEKAIWLMEQNK